MTRSTLLLLALASCAAPPRSRSDVHSLVRAEEAAVERFFGAPFVREFDLEGRFVRELPLPERYVPRATADGRRQGVRDRPGRRLEHDLPALPQGLGQRRQRVHDRQVGPGHRHAARQCTVTSRRSGPG